MFKGSNKCFDYINIEKTIPLYNQEELFVKYTGVYPDTSKRFLSLFRTDKDPGCRFKWHSGILYFVDNVGYNNKLYFNIVDTVSILYNISLKEAIHKIIQDAPIVNNYQKIITNIKKNRPEIRFKYKPWDNNNYFDMNPEILLAENVYHVTDYWIKFNNDFEYNPLHNPNHTLCIAYHFPNTNNTKLYFPEKKENKWYTNCINEVFGEHKIDEYLNKNNELIIITKSQKDRLLLDYKFGYNCIAPQNEGIDFGYIVPKLKLFKKQIIIFDNDKSGQIAAAKYSEKYDMPWLNLDISKDVYEAVQLYGYNNTEKYIKHII